MNSKDYLIREYREDDFDAVTILWRVAREKLLPEGQTDTGHVGLLVLELLAHEGETRAGAERDEPLA